MTALKKLTGSGMSPLAATQINGDVDTGAANAGAIATGSAQADAYKISACTTRFGTVAASTGCVLPIGAPSDDYAIANFGANTLNVYPPVGGTINNGSVNAAVTIAANGSAFLVCMDGAGLNWVSK